MCALVITFIVLVCPVTKKTLTRVFGINLLIQMSKSCNIKVIIDIDTVFVYLCSKFNLQKVYFNYSVIKISWKSFPFSVKSQQLIYTDNKTFTFINPVFFFFCLIMHKFSFNESLFKDLF